MFIVYKYLLIRLSALCFYKHLPYANKLRNNYIGAHMHEPVGTDN